MHENRRRSGRIAMYLVESGIPIPPAREKGRQGKYISTLREMDLGDSFLVPCADKAAARKVQISILCSVRRCPWGVVTRIVEGGLRVWKIKKM
jgi:hypothetical protein